MSHRIDEIKEAFSLSANQVDSLAERFRQEMAAGLASQPSSLKMLSSYIAKPKSNESGTFLALDFGGTNVRVLLVELLGGGRWLIKKKIVAPLKDPAGKYDYMAANVQAEELFDFLADQVALVAQIEGSVFLGHTFSFPCFQQEINQAILIKWTKEIKTAGVVGSEVNGLLTAALKRRGLGRVIPCAIINDTVGTLLNAAYIDSGSHIGVICGTGHNGCYYDESQNMIINMESGNFDRLPFTDYDQKLDKASEKSGEQGLEKMVAGRYLGELARLIAVDFLPPDFVPPVLAGEDLGVILNSNYKAVPQLEKLPLAEKELLTKIAAMIVERSARLVAASIIGVLRYIDFGIKKQHVIAIDGSLYEKMPGYAETVAATLAEVLKDKMPSITLKLTKDGSGVGAAIAAAVAERKQV